MTFELAAQAPLKHLPLLSPSETFVRELLIYQDNPDNRILRLVERTSLRDGTPPSSNEHGFNFRCDAAIPFYTIADKPRSDWIMQVINSYNTSPLTFSFERREDLLELQQVFTGGYRPSKSFEDIKCISILGGSSLVGRYFRRDVKHQGTAEAQLWAQPDPELGLASPLLSGQLGHGPDLVSPLSPVSTHSSPGNTSTPSLVPTFSSIPSSSSVLKIHTDPEGGKSAMVAQLSPPLLVIFLNEDTHYTMLKFDITHADIKPILNGWLCIGSAGLAVQRLSVERENLRSWNLCAIGTLRKCSSVETLKSTALNLKFKDSVDLEAFRKEFLSLRLQRLKQLRELETAKIIMDEGTPRQPMSPAIPGPQEFTALRRAQTGSAASDPMPSGNPRAFRRSSSPAIALSISGSFGEPFTTEAVLQELDTKRPPVQIDGLPLEGPWEMDARQR